MLLRILVAIAITLKIFVTVAHAESRVDSILTSDREEQIQKINEMTQALNVALNELGRLNSELDSAVKQNNESHTVKVWLRNGGAAAAAISLAGTILYQTKGLNPSKIILAGGYSVSALSALMSVLEHRSLKFSLEEIAQLKISIKDLEVKINIEKKNLNKEIRLLCLMDGGTEETCAI